LLSPHFHTLFLDGVFSADIDGMFHPAPVPRQEGVETLVWKVRKRILRFLERRGVITLVTAPGDGEVTVVTDESMAEKDPLLAKLLAAATASAGEACSATKRREIRIVLAPDERPVGKGTLCGQSHGFNLPNATPVATNDKDGRERLCRYIWRPPLANDRLKVLDNGDVHLDFKRPWSDGTPSIALAPVALIARLAALVPPPRRHMVLYCGVLSSHAASRKEVVPTPAITVVGQGEPKGKSKYLRWSELLRRVFGIETICQKCHVPLRLLSLIKSEAIAKKILTAMHLPADVPKLRPARPPPQRDQDARGPEDYIN
jgi:hypothetical protein